MLYSIAESPPPRAAIYVRTSTRKQVERGTSLTQLDLLRHFARAQDLWLSDEFVDDGVPGGVPLGHRPAGAALLRAAESGAFDVLLVQNLDRLGRSRDVLLSAIEQLKRSGITVRTTLPAPISDITQIEAIAGYAEYERAALGHRIAAGRDRAIRAGLWTNSPVPFGYDVDRERRLVPSERVVGEISEAQLVVSLFEEVANGSTAVAQAKRFNDLRVPKVRRYTNGRQWSYGPTWKAPRLNQLLHSPIYKGIHVVSSRNGRIQATVPSLVSTELWERVQRRLKDNDRGRHQHGDRPPRVYRFKGRIRCGDCGRAFVGYANVRKGVERIYYRCSGMMAVINPDPADRCRAICLNAAEFERELASALGTTDLASNDLSGARLGSVVVWTMGSRRRKRARIEIVGLDGGSRTIMYPSRS